MYEELLKELTNTEVFFTSINAVINNFSVNTIIMFIMMFFCAVGGIDKIRGNKLGYGEKFDEAFATLKPLALAFSISATFVLGDHLGFTAGVEQQMVLPMIVSKMTAGITALLFANILAPKLLKK